MEIGLVLPTMPDGASAEGIEASAEAAARLGWSAVWTTDHVLVPRSAAGEYGRIFEAIVTLAYVAGRHPALRLGASVIVVPQRNAVVLAKELASLDALSRGRLIAGVGVGWNRTEFGNLGVSDRFHVRGAYLDETIALWRHLWGGSREPFEGRFHRFDDAVFEPLPVRGAELPIWVGGRHPAALRRAGRLGDGYHSSASSPSQYAERVPVVRAAAEAAGRPMPVLSARVAVRFDQATGSFYALRGDPEAMAADLRAFADAGVSEVALGFGETDAERSVAAIERFDREVRPLIA
ncbi:MAG TPA: TIGR03619 family F420-dependent LLM class oxidoreductase [Candidatus Limnocylindrales bacterium]|jgi:probable F420-dependent oxidoreductase